MKTISFKNDNTEDISEVLELVLEEAGYEQQRIIKYVFALEEAMLVWRNTFPSDKDIVINRIEKRAKSVLTITLEGSRCNPIEVEKEGDAYCKTRNRILAGCGVEFKYFYRNGTNTLKLTFPHKNSERKIFVWNFLAIAVPIALQTMLMNIIAATDGLMLGILSQEALSSIALVNSFVSIFTMMFEAGTVGLGILVAQFWGKGNRDSISKAFVSAVRIGVVVSLIFFLGSFLLPDKIIGLYTNDSVLIGIGASYLKAISITFLLNGIAALYNCVLVNTGRVLKATLFSIISAVINLVLNAFLIFGLCGFPKLEIRGAAIATVVASIVLICCVIVEMLREGMISTIAKYLFSSKQQYGRVLMKQCSVLFAQKTSWCLALNTIVALFGHLGSDILAARLLALMIAALVDAFASGIGQGAGVLMGNELGRGQFDQAKRKAPWLLKVAVIIGVMGIPMVCILCALAKLLPINLTSDALYYYNMFSVILAFNSCVKIIINAINGGFLYAGGETLHVFIIDALCSWGIVVLGGLLLIYVIKAPLIVCILFLSGQEFFSFPFKYARYRKKKWLRNIT